LQWIDLAHFIFEALVALHVSLNITWTYILKSSQ